MVEDDRSLAGELAAGLARAGHTATVALNLKDARKFCAKQSFSIVILDRLLPDEDGLDFIPWLREHHPHAGVLVLSALGALDARVGGLNAGADDYLSKPYAMEELLARIGALARRSNGTPVTLQIPPLVLDRLARLLTVNREPVHLNQREFALLEFLMLHAGEPVTRSMVLHEVWGYSFEPGTNVVDVHVSRLRSKLEACGCKGILITERGVGYRLIESKG